MSAAAREEQRPPRPAEIVRDVALAALQRAPQPPEHTVGLTLNAKGDVQIEVTGRGHELEALGQSVQAEFDRLRAAYPRGAAA